MLVSFLTVATVSFICILLISMTLASLLASFLLLIAIVNESSSIVFSKCRLVQARKWFDKRKKENVFRFTCDLLSLAHFQVYV